MVAMALLHHRFFSLTGDGGEGGYQVPKSIKQPFGLNNQATDFNYSSTFLGKKREAKLSRKLLRRPCRTNAIKSERSSSVKADSNGKEGGT